MLNPTHSAKAIDISLQMKMFHDSELGPNGEVWIAFSDVSDRRFGYLLVADLQEDFQVIPSDLHLSDEEVYWAYEANTTSAVARFSKHSPLLLKVMAF